MTQYVVGFLFNEAGNEVALLQKAQPEWQKGLLNGLGGKIEEGESSIDAMNREFKEESGVDGLDWQYRCHIGGEHFSLNVFSCFSNRIDEVQSMEAEKVGIYSVGELTLSRSIPNLRWILPMLQERNLDIGDFSYR